jgi:hypothetical protein
LPWLPSPNATSACARNASTIAAIGSRGTAGREEADWASRPADAMNNAPPRATLDRSVNAPLKIAKGRV